MTGKEYAELLNLRKRVKNQRAEIAHLTADLRDCVNELCLKCGEYKQRHLGACDGCRWRAKQ